MVAITTFAQGSGAKSSLVDETKFFAALSGGPSIPVGVFQKKDFTVTSEAGLAKVGYVLNANLGYKFHNNFGIASTVFYSMYKLDQKAIDGLIGRSATSITRSCNWLIRLLGQFLYVSGATLFLSRV